jgi:four helix bundle protein
VTAIKRFQDIQAWQKGRELVREVYRASSDGVFAKDFGLRDQIRRAAVSVMSNVAEGFARKGDRDFAHFLDIARGSAVECQSLAYVALDVGYISEEVFGRLYQTAEERASLIGGFASYLRKST